MLLVLTSRSLDSDRAASLQSSSYALLGPGAAEEGAGSSVCPKASYATSQLQSQIKLQSVKVYYNRKYRSYLGASPGGISSG